MTKRITVSGVGCCLVDRLYSNISFTSESFSEYLSKKPGDGGLTPGKLVFMEEFEKFAGRDFLDVQKVLTQGQQPDKINIGGPSIVALIHAAQMLESTDCTCRFYGCGGNDDDGEFLLSALRKTPVNTENYKVAGKMTPSTVVLSDPQFDGGHGERIFINSIGAAWDFSPEELGDDFFDSDIVVFGGTALVPNIHDNLTQLLEKAKSKGCFTLVNTVYDFRNEKANPAAKWPLGKSDESYQNIDLLIADFEEALRLSGKPALDEAMQFFAKKGTKAVLITNGSNPVQLFSDGSAFLKSDHTQMPVSSSVSEELKKGHSGDTTGCGDNFVGGVIASLVQQLRAGVDKLDLKEACTWGIISGGYACFYVGGTFMEQYPGEKLELIRPYYDHYKYQSGNEK
jgi:sugar/nucleoside kinase (ribokinase family)